MIRAVGRALAIFDAYDNEHLSLSLQEIAERIHMPKTTAFRLVNTLERAGFLIRMDNQQYCLSLKMARLGGLVRSTLSIREIARPVMLQVNEQTSETITLNTIVGNDRMVLEVVDTPAPLMSMARPGQHMPLYLGASSRILLAYMEPHDLERVVKANMNVPDFDRTAFDRELARFRRQGYAISRSQRVPGLTAIAVPIFDINGEVRHCLALTGPSVRVDSRDQELADILLVAGRDISTRLGASPEHSADLKLLMADTTADVPGLARERPAVKKAPARKKTAARVAQQ
ncbi:IclR family transcriptional regulator [Alicycliphilus denitrificans]|uniref:IclR family transcriptional regulator n=1 Tax=Alicycliphilus denitrificans TaxID=179636 RepID=A0A420KIG3_9BURK|nr:IclR family transcriptional regulator [Alicycliphilus denitrificans]MBN9573844.1 IclR family transcriptional regulator [Alicycliphilus denitrificans]OJW83569.1 MAG: IclR family transcriptional regulator [Alicycliphilus sp. 69-12]RKJ99745.1 IclR family transcriptional regulator [Alicycliphilus denitrificans]BCN38980.1 IclR family transcriptional regulator [Alicycliphilus denitrificans]